MLVQIIGDDGHGDLAVTEVVQRLELHFTDAEPIVTLAPPSRRGRPSSASRTWA